MTEPSFNQLPVELLLRISEHVAGNSIARFLLNGSSGTMLKDNRATTDLRNMALVCRTLRPIAQEMLFRDPLLSDTISSALFYEDTSLFRFIYCLTCGPHLRGRVKSLRVALPSSHVVIRNDRPARTQLRFRRFLDSTALSSVVRQTLEAGVIATHRLSLIGVLMALTPQLEHLSILPSDRSSEYHGLGLLDLLQGTLDRAMGPRIMNNSGFAQIPGFGNLEMLKCMMDHLMRLQTLFMLPKLTTLDVTPVYNRSVPFHQQVRDFAQFQALRPVGDRSNFDHIIHLRIDAQTRFLIEHSNLVSCLEILAHFRALRTLDIYGLPSCTNYHHDTVWNIHTRIVRAIATRIPERLEVLRLPNMGRETPLAERDITRPDFSGFLQLRRLLVPQDVLVARVPMRFDGGRGAFDVVMAPLDALPPMLESLTIFDADPRVFGFVEYIVSQEESCPDLNHVTLLFAQAPKFTDKDYELLREKVDGKNFWRTLEKSRITWTVGRDDLNHAVELLN
jgi:hypothetical protein